MKVVRVKWVDSCSGDCYWTLLKDYKPAITTPVTYGFVIYEDDDMISIAQTYAEGDDEVPPQINGVITIPKAAVLEIDTIII